MPRLRTERMHAEGPDNDRPPLPTDFAYLADETVGTLVQSDPQREVRRLEVEANGETRTVYLKRTFWEQVRKCIEMVFRFGYPRTASSREAELLRRLGGEGFAVARTLVWGERRVLGWPTRSFIVTDNVSGRELHDLLQAGDPHATRRLWAEMGDLLGRLHARGYFHIMRPKDIIVADDAETRHPPGTFVMIDREVARPGPKRYTHNRAAHALARCAAKALRSNQMPNRGEAIAFLRAYRRALPAMTREQAAEYRRTYERSLARIASGKRYRGRIGADQPNGARFSSSPQ